MHMRAFSFQEAYIINVSGIYTSNRKSMTLKWHQPEELKGNYSQINSQRIKTLRRPSESSGASFDLINLCIFSSLLQRDSGISE